MCSVSKNDDGKALRGHVCSARDVRNIFLKIISVCFLFGLKKLGFGWE